MKPVATILPPQNKNGVDTEVSTPSVSILSGKPLLSGEGQQRDLSGSLDRSGQDALV